MNKKQRQAAIARFKAIMAAHGAIPQPKEWEGSQRIEYRLPWGGFNLMCSMSADDADWVACKWDISGPAAAAYWQAARTDYGCGADVETTPERTALWVAKEAEYTCNMAAFKASGLPYDNPYTLKWNHHGHTGDEALDSLEQGLAAHKPQQEGASHE